MKDVAPAAVGLLAAPMLSRERHPLPRPPVAASMCPGVILHARHDHIVHRLFFAAKCGCLGMRECSRPRTWHAELNQVSHACPPVWHCDRGAAGAGGWWTLRPPAPPGS